MSVLTSNTFLFCSTVTTSPRFSSAASPASGTVTPSLQEAVGSVVVLAIARSGHLLSVGWPLTQRLGISLEGCVGRSIASLTATKPSVEWSFLAHGEPVPWKSPPFCRLTLNSVRLGGVLNLKAVPSAGSQFYWVGSLEVTEVDWLDSALPIAPEVSMTPVPSRLIQLIWDIRRTLDLETVWQQTVNGLTDILQADWGVVCSYHLHEPEAAVMATSCNPGCPPPLPPRLRLADYPCIQQALKTRQPVMTTAEWSEGEVQFLCGIIRHQGEPSGIVLLCADPERPLQGLEPTQFQEVLDQVGIAIAHADLLRDAQGLADELKAANQRLLKKHEELEEARQQAEEASRLKSEFLANTSHELRTPLNGMIGFLRLILDGMADDPEEQQEFLEEAHKSALHLLNLINDVLDIAKIEAGKMQIDMTPVNLRELFADLENFTRPQAEQKGLDFNISLPPTRDEIIVYGNYQRILQVMLNLVGNAIKFTHEGHVTIGAEIKSQKITFQDQDWPGLVKVSVADSGIGVSLEKQNRLFQSFSQVDGERTRQYGGTGLGLAISQRLIEAMGGVVHFVSMGEGLGSTVTFTTLLYQEPVMIG